MKKSLLLSFAILITAMVNAQSSVYHSFPDSNATWNVVAQGCCWAGCPGPPNPNPVLGDYNFSYRIGSDTIINSTAYHTLHKSGSMHEYCSSGNFINNWSYYNDYAGAYREDTSLRRVYLVQPFNSTECVLYDFAANVGDTINFCEQGCALVLSIDSVLIGNNFRKRWNMSSQTTAYSVIEGIGSTSGLLEPLCPFEYFGTLTCFTQEQQTLYPDTVTSCNLITDVTAVPGFSQVLTIAPNPFSSRTTVYTQIPMRGATLSVLNCVGEIVAQENDLNGLTFSFDRNSLPQGLYFFQLTQNNTILATSKVVIAD